jgi:RimJ/RimL family protein N-acetyltransferase
MISFRKLEETDFETLFNWLQQSHVKEWWDDGDDTIEKVRMHYSSDADVVTRFVLLSDTKHPIGYFQFYIEASDVIGIDQFIGEVSLINRGLGTNAVKPFVQLIQDSNQLKTIIVDPETENHRAIRCYEKAGFRFEKLGIGEDGKQAYFMRMDTDA